MLKTQTHTANSRVGFNVVSPQSETAFLREKAPRGHGDVFLCLFEPVHCSLSFSPVAVKPDTVPRVFPPGTSSKSLLPCAEPGGADRLSKLTNSTQPFGIATHPQNAARRRQSHHRGRVCTIGRALSVQTGGILERICRNTTSMYPLSEASAQAAVDAPVWEYAGRSACLSRRHRHVD